MERPPETIVDTFCLFFCTDAGIDYLDALLDDPKNDARPTMELYAEATKYQRDEYLRPRLTAAALEHVNLDDADDPGYDEISHRNRDLPRYRLCRPIPTSARP